MPRTVWWISRDIAEGATVLALIDVVRHVPEVSVERPPTGAVLQRARLMFRANRFS